MAATAHNRFMYEIFLKVSSLWSSEKVGRNITVIDYAHTDVVSVSHLLYGISTVYSTLQLTSAVRLVDSSGGKFIRKPKIHLNKIKSALI